MKIDFQSDIIQWDDVSVLMKDIETRFQDIYNGEDSGAVAEEIKHIKSILDAEYKPAEPADIVAQCNHLNKDEKSKLLALLEEYRDRLGQWKGEKYDIELKPDAKPYHARAFPIPTGYAKKAYFGKSMIPNGRHQRSSYRRKTVR